MSLRVSSLFGVAGKSVLVTGGGRGIGKMIAEGFVANGSTVYISSRDQAALEATADELTAAHSSDGGGCCVAVPGNLYTRAGCEELAATALMGVPVRTHLWGRPEALDGKKPCPGLEAGGPFPDLLADLLQGCATAARPRVGSRRTLS